MDGRAVVPGVGAGVAVVDGADVATTAAWFGVDPAGDGTALLLAGPAAVVDVALTGARDTAALGELAVLAAGASLVAVVGATGPPGARAGLAQAVSIAPATRSMPNRATRWLMTRHDASQPPDALGLVATARFERA